MNCEKWLEILLQTEGTVLCDDVRDLPAKS